MHFIMWRFRAETPLSFLPMRSSVSVFVAAKCGDTEVGSRTGRKRIVKDAVRVNLLARGPGAIRVGKLVT